MKINRYIQLTEGVLTVNGKPIPLPSLIESVISSETLIIVRLIVDSNTDGQNVLALDLEANLIWKIQKSPYGDKRFDHPFYRLWVSEEGELIAGDGYGIDYKVNLVDGTLSEPIAFNRF